MFYAAYSDCCDEVGHSTVVKFTIEAEAEAHLNEVAHDYLRFGKVLTQEELADWVAGQPFWS